MIKGFATKHNLKITIDRADGTPLVRGERGHLFEYDSERMGLMYLSGHAELSERRIKKCLAAGMEITQHGDTEFAAAFDPNSWGQSFLAIESADCKIRSNFPPQSLVSEEQAQNAQ